MGGLTITINRRRFVVGTGAALAAPWVVPSARAQGAAVTLRLHHFLPPVSNAHAKLLVPWADKVMADSDGAIRMDIFPAMQLGGTPQQLFDQARDGVADIVWTLPGNTPGRFPHSEVMELPFIAAEQAMVNAQAAQDLADRHMAEETAEVQLLSYWAHDAGHIHANRPIATMEDMTGVKLRNPTRLTGEALQALGAVSVGMPIPQVPESLAQGVIDGAVIPWEVVPAVKVHELVTNHTEITGTPTLYVASFFLAMNKDAYEGMPEELRAVMDENSGMAFARRAGEMWDTEAVNVRDMVADRGNTIIQLAPEEKARWIEATEPVHQAWIAEMEGRGIDGGALIEEARALVAKYDT